MSTKQPTRLRGPVPDGLMHITLDVPNVVFEELRETCRRSSRGTRSNR